MGISKILFFETRTTKQRDLLCRLSERFYGEGKKVQIVADSTTAAQHVDQLLWTFSDESFIPHRILNPGSCAQEFFEPVIIVIGETRLEGFDVLICDIPVRLDFMRLYPLVVHFVLQDDPDRLLESRQLWQNARDEDLEVKHVPYALAEKASIAP